MALPLDPDHVHRSDDCPTAWFAVLDRDRTDGDRLREEKALAELRRLCITVNWGIASGTRRPGPKPTLAPIFEKLLGLTEVAELLGVSRKMVERLVTACTLRSVKIGSAIRVEPRALGQYIDGASAPD
jgi:excisionase family DNA binding protein